MKVQASLSAVTVVFAFDPDPATAPARALHVLTVRKALPRVDLGPKERFADAAARAAEDAGVDLGGRRNSHGRLHLVGLDDAPGRSRSVTAWFYATATYAKLDGATWSPVGRVKLDSADNAAFKASLEKLRSDARHLAGAVALVGDPFTGDDLLRLHVSLHGGPEGSDRTFRRRIQELRDTRVLRPVRGSEVAGLRQRVERFRSPPGTGGRPPELLRYAGSGGEDEQLASLRARRN
jgi:hypothetical protein